MREARKLHESNGANDAAPANPKTSDTFDAVFPSFDGVDMQSTTPNDPLSNGKPERTQSDDISSSNASVASRGDNSSNDASAVSRNDGTSDSAAAGSTGKASRNVVFVNHDKRKAGREVAIVILCVAVVVLILLLCLRFFACSSDVYDPSAKEGMTPNKTEEEIREAMEHQIEEGKFAISIYSVIKFPDGASEGDANIANVPNNNFDMQVTITEDATGDILYESGIIKPNSYVDKIKLNKDLDAGTHDATATFHALDKETHEESGMTNAKVTIYVEN